jgi:hypothetical protein
LVNLPVWELAATWSVVKVSGATCKLVIKMTSHSRNLVNARSLLQACLAPPIIWGLESKNSFMILIFICLAVMGYEIYFVISCLTLIPIGYPVISIDLAK